MHSDFYERGKVIDSLKKLVLLLLDECDELAGKVEQLEAAQPKWISVEERHPEPDCEVLLYYKIGFTVMGYWNDDFCEWVGMAGEEIVRPDYWMPLPEPPKEG